MTTSPLSHAADRLIRAENKYNAMKTYQENLPANPDVNLDVRVNWTWGARTVGYTEFEQAVREEISDGLRQYIKDALKKARAELDAAKTDLKILARA